MLITRSFCLLFEGVGALILKTRTCRRSPPPPPPLSLLRAFSKSDLSAAVRHSLAYGWGFLLAGRTGTPSARE